ncbi:MAG: hypothetical protein WC508_03115 [Patescibacteria group bacterium]
MANKTNHRIVKTAAGGAKIVLPQAAAPLETYRSKDTKWPWNGCTACHGRGIAITKADQPGLCIGCFPAAQLTAPDYSILAYRQFPEEVELSCLPCQQCQPGEEGVNLSVKGHVKVFHRAPVLDAIVLDSKIVFEPSCAVCRSGCSGAGELVIVGGVAVACSPVVGAITQPLRAFSESAGFPTLPCQKQGVEWHNPTPVVLSDGTVVQLRRSHPTVQV